MKFIPQPPLIYGQKYWFLDEYMQIRMTHFKNRAKDGMRHHSFNCFRTRGGAEAAQFEFITSLKQYNE